jgi:hypothetical protein
MILGGLSGVTTARPRGLGIINGIRADPRGFTDVYGSVEKDTVAYGSGTWIRTHDVWVLWKRHVMIRMLLTGRTVCVCQYWMYGCGQEGMFLAWG